jgi:ureidoglycolate hydrolase
MTTVVLTLVLVLSQWAVAFAVDFVAGDKAKVSCSYLNVREGAGTNNAVITAIPKDTEVTILEKSGEWYKVKYGENSEGYVYGTYLTGSELLPVLKAQPLTDEAFAPFGKVIHDINPPNTYEDANCKWEADLDTFKDYSSLSVNFFKGKVRPMVITNLEYHNNTQEFLAPMNGAPAILVVAPGGDVDFNKEAKAFYLTGNEGVMMNKGVRHMCPFPTTDKDIDMYIIFKTNTAAEDCYYEDFETPFHLVK